MKELREWLVGRVADDDDIVIDDLQEDYNEQFEQEDEKNGIKVRMFGHDFHIILTKCFRVPNSGRRTLRRWRLTRGNLLSSGRTGSGTGLGSARSGRGGGRMANSWGRE